MCICHLWLTHVTIQGGGTFRSTIVQVLNPSVHHHVHFDSVVYLMYIYFSHISQDTNLFPGSYTFHEILELWIRKQWYRLLFLCQHNDHGKISLTFVSQG